MKMQNDDHMIVVIVDETESNNIQDFAEPIQIQNLIPEDLDEAMLVKDLIEKIDEHEEHIEMKLGDTDVKITLAKFEEELEYLDEEAFDEEETEYLDEEALDEDIFISKYASVSDCNKHSCKLVNPSQRKSFVKKLIKDNPEFSINEEKLVEALVTVMKNVRPPTPPEDYFLKNQETFECAICAVSTRTLPAVTRHYIEKHGERYLICYACGVDFRSTTNLYKHEKHCSAPDAQIVLRARALFLGKKGRGRPFLVSSDSQKSSMGLVSRRRRYRCSECSAEFLWASNLRSHTNLHKGLRPYLCPHCPARYTSSSALIRHLSIHSKEDMICDHCSRTFKFKSSLIVHMDTHAPEPKYGCVQCSRRFMQKSDLQMHVNRDHNHLPSPYPCNVCPKRYNKASLLKDHLKKKHGLQLMTKNMYFKLLPNMSDSDVIVGAAKTVFK